MIDPTDPTEIWDDEGQPDRDAVVGPNDGADEAIDLSGAVTETIHEVSAHPEEDDPVVVLEMRQVAGLTAGSVMGLHAGAFEFNESEADLGFGLVVHGPDDVVVVPGTAQAQVDEFPVAAPIQLGDGILNVGTACFTVRSPRPEPTAQHRLAVLEETTRPANAILTPDVGLGPEPDPIPPPPELAAVFGEDDAPELGEHWWDFVGQILEVRSQVAERHRALHPDPEQLRSRLDRLDPGLWDRTIDHSLFARFALAYATIPWEPRFDFPERIPSELHGPIREISRLPWVPVTANLMHGPLGIVGSRAAVLAAARNAVLSLACLSSPTDLVFSIVTAKGLIDDWRWTSTMPNSLFVTRPETFPIVVADGMSHFEGAGLDPAKVLRNEMGLIVLAQSLDELPDYCGTILQISADGRCQVSNHMGEQALGTPIGVTAGFAGEAAVRLAGIIGDEQDVHVSDPVGVDELAPAYPPPQHDTADKWLDERRGFEPDATSDLPANGLPDGGFGPTDSLLALGEDRLDDDFRSEDYIDSSVELFAEEPQEQLTEQYVVGSDGTPEPARPVAPPAPPTTEDDRVVYDRPPWGPDDDLNTAIEVGPNRPASFAPIDPEAETVTFTDAEPSRDEQLAEAEETVTADEFLTEINTWYGDEPDSRRES